MTLLPWLLFYQAVADPALISRIVERQEQLPWFWSAPMEGVVDIPYRYEVEITRRILDLRGRVIKPDKRGSALAEWRAVRLEVIPLAFGTEQRCLGQDGRAPCSPEWIEAMAKAVARRDAADDGRRAEVQAMWTSRRARWRADWKSFAAAHRFEAADTANTIRFTGNGETGEFAFDPATFDIMRLSRRGTANGERFLIELQRGLDGRYLPARVETTRRQGQRIEERVNTYQGYQRFDATTTIRFSAGDPPP